MQITPEESQSETNPAETTQQEEETTEKPEEVKEDKSSEDIQIKGKSRPPSEEKLLVISNAIWQNRNNKEKEYTSARKIGGQEWVKEKNLEGNKSIKSILKKYLEKGQCEYNKGQNRASGSQENCKPITLEIE